NARRSIPDPGGVVFPWAAGRKIGVTSPEIDPAPAGSDLVGGASSGGVAPGYCMDPLRGSRMDRSEGVLGAQKAGKAPSGYARHGPSALNSHAANPVSIVFRQPYPRIGAMRFCIARNVPLC
ncbi:MAG: hypothetical protein WBO19_02045, partial [Terriglobia bacterium]